MIKLSFHFLSSYIRAFYSILNRGGKCGNPIKNVFHYTKFGTEFLIKKSLSHKCSLNVKYP